MTVNVVLDIDGVLAGHSPNSLRPVIFFNNRGAILTAIKTHYLFPGVVEFIRLLFLTEKIKVSFYSGGDKVRNPLFVNALLHLALPEHKDIQADVLSDLVKSTSFQLPEDCDSSGIYAGGYHKDLLKVVEKGGILEETILVDDDLSYSASIQIKHLLSVKETTVKTFENLLSKRKVYQKEGFRYLPCYLLVKEPIFFEPGSYLYCMMENQLKTSQENQKTMYEEKILERKCLLIFRIEEKFYVCFLDKDSGTPKQLIISRENNEHLLQGLTELYDQKANKQAKDNCPLGQKRARDHLIKDEDLIAHIGKMVLSSNGLATKICRSVNRIYYITGLLFTALNESDIHKTSLSQALFQLQFKKQENTLQRKFNAHSMQRVDFFYEKGLKILQTINPNLQFTTPHNYKKYSKFPDKEEEMSALKNHLVNS